MTNYDTKPADSSGGAEKMSQGQSEFYWRCGGCERLFSHGNHEKQWKHANEEHGSFDAVTFEAVAPFEIDEAENGTEPADSVNGGDE